MLLINTTKIFQVFCIMILNANVSYGRIPSIRLCADEKCESIISIARTVINFSGAHPNHVSFRGNTQCRVMAKSSGDNSDLWEIEVQGRRGFAPKRMIMEQKILVKADKLIEVISNDAGSSNNVSVKQDPDKPVEELLNSTEQTEHTNYSIFDEEISSNAVDQTKQENIVNSNKPISTNDAEQIEPQNASKSIESTNDIENESKKEIQSEDTLKGENENAHEHLNLNPAYEPLTIKRDMYKTGQQKEQETINENIDLEIIGQGQQNDELDKSNKIADVEKKTEDFENQEIIKVHNPYESESPFGSNSVYIDQTLKMAAHENNDENDIYEHVKTIYDSATRYSSSIIDSSEMHDSQFNSYERDIHSIVPNGFNDEVNLLLTKDKDNILVRTEEEIGSSSRAMENTEATNQKSVLSGPNISMKNREEHFSNNEDRKEQFEDNNKINLINTNTVTNENENKDEITTNMTKSPKSIVEKLNITLNTNAETTEITKANFDDIKNNNDETPIHPTKVISDPITMQSVVEKNIVPSSDEKTHNKDSIAIVSNSKENDLITKNDIFSPDSQVETQTVPAKNLEVNWYDGILIFMVDTLYSVRDLFNRNDKEQTKGANNEKKENSVDEFGYCENLPGKMSCPRRDLKFIYAYNDDNFSKVKDKITSIEPLNEFLTKVIDRSDLVLFLLITAFTILIFIFGHDCIIRFHKENQLIHQLNVVERKLFLSQKENNVIKADLIETNKKLSSIANKSFGADDMIKQHEEEKKQLQNQITFLEKELETAAEAGLELNKMISELLSNQSGDSIINSVEELQHQLNEQETNAIYINNLLAEKSRENSELHVLLSDTNLKFGLEIQQLQKINEKLIMEKGTLETQLNETINSLRDELEENMNVISNLKEEQNLLRKEYDDVLSKFQMASARAEALEDCIQKLKTFNGIDDYKTILEITDSNSKCIAMKKEIESLKDKLEAETECKNRLQEEAKEINRLRVALNQNEKEKLEAQTRLDVLSSYFKEKESQLQKELSVKEALFMKQQGESTGTIEQIRSSQEEIQKLRSQNDELRAEIEAQSAAHKAQMSNAEARAHDSWMAAKQAERRLEEARAEASILRKKLTSLTFNTSNMENSFASHINVPSPIHMESVSPISSPVLPLNLPPLPLIPAQIFTNPGMASGNHEWERMGAPFHILPPPPLALPSEINRPAPLGI